MTTLRYVAMSCSGAGLGAMTLKADPLVRTTEDPHHVSPRSACLTGHIWPSAKPAKPVFDIIRWFYIRICHTGSIVNHSISLLFTHKLRLLSTCIFNFSPSPFLFIQTTSSCYGHAFCRCISHESPLIGAE